MKFTSIIRDPAICGGQPFFAAPGYAEDLMASLRMAIR